MNRLIKRSISKPYFAYQIPTDGITILLTPTICNTQLLYCSVLIWCCWYVSCRHVGICCHCCLCKNKMTAGFDFDRAQKPSTLSATPRMQLIELHVCIRAT